MKYLIILIVIIHSIIHVFGFYKSFNITALKGLSLYYSKIFGLFWFITALVFLLFGISLLVNFKFSWFLGLIGVLSSQILIFYSWKDAKFGTIINLITLIYVIYLICDFYFQRTINSERKYILSKLSNTKSELINEKDILELPIAIQKWLKRSGVIGKSKIYSADISQDIELKLNPGQTKWFKAKAFQKIIYNEPAFIWYIKFNLNPFIEITGRDKLIDGHSEMKIKLNSIINIVNERGEKLDESTYQRFLGEIVWNPTFVLSPYLNWSQINDSIAEAKFTLNGKSVTGTFYFNKDGDFVKFETYRYKENTPDALKYPWIIEAFNYNSFDGIRIPTAFKATWKLKEGNWNWLILKIKNVEFNHQKSF